MTKLSQKGLENLKRSIVRKNYEEPPERRRGSDGLNVCPFETQVNTELQQHEEADPQAGFRKGGLFLWINPWSQEWDHYKRLSLAFFSPFGLSLCPSLCDVRAWAQPHTHFMCHNMSCCMWVSMTSRRRHWTPMQELQMIVSSRRWVLGNELRASLNC